MTAKRTVGRTLALLLLAGATLASAHLALAASPLDGTFWQADDGQDCFIHQMHFEGDGSVFLLHVSLDETSGRWKLAGTALTLTATLGPNYPPIVFNGTYQGASIKADYSWNEGADRESCTFHKIAN